MESKIVDKISYLYHSGGQCCDAHKEKVRMYCFDCHINVCSTYCFEAHKTRQFERIDLSAPDFARSTDGKKWRFRGTPSQVEAENIKFLGNVHDTELEIKDRCRGKTACRTSDLMSGERFTARTIVTEVI